VEYNPIGVDQAMGALAILTVSLPIEMNRRRRWVNVYFNTMKACMEDRGYRWISDHEEPGISPLEMERGEGMKNRFHNNKALVRD
jgi:hypothetical protein